MNDYFQINNCPVCGEQEFSDFKKVPDWLVSKEIFRLKQCDSCGFKFTSNAPLPKDIGPYYDSDEYVEHSDTKKGLTYSLYHIARELMLKYKFKKIQALGVGKKLLDVGSGSGYFINFLKNKGYETTGVEISEKARQLCMDNFGIETNEPSAFLNKTLGTNYDLITLWHVFEHVYTYEEFFELFNYSLSESGRLILALPNCNSTDAQLYNEHWAAYDTPRHLWHFTPEMIEQFAKRRGFILDKKYRLPLDPFFNAMVSASYKESFTFLPITMLKAFWAWMVSLGNLNKSSSLFYVFKKA